jgi:hypothetical protein
LGRIATIVMAAALVILAVIGLNVLWRAHARDARFDRFISQVKNHEGVLITDYGKQEDGKYFVSGVVAGPPSSGVLPVEDFGLRRDEVNVKLISHVFVVDQSNRNEQLQNFSDQLHQLDGIPWPTDGSRTARAWLESTTNRIANAYLLGQALGRPFIVVINHPSNLKASADKISGQIAWRLYLQGIYDRNLVRTHAVDKQPARLRVLRERIVGE